MTSDVQPISPCACGADTRLAVSVDPEIKASVLNRLRRIEGQVRGLHKMVEDQRYCADLVGSGSTAVGWAGIDAEPLEVLRH